MFSIGEFSRITGLTIKTLRHYHEAGLLPPSRIDPQTGYRYYSAGQVDTARLISLLRQMDFPLAEIRELLGVEQEGAALLDVLQRHRRSLDEKLRRYRAAARSLDQVIAQEEARRAMAKTSLEVQEKTVDAMRIASVRMKGKYAECGKGFSKIGRRFGRYISGKPMLLHHDAEYREEDADFEACMPIRQGDSADGVVVRDLPGGRCVALVHQGPYDQLGRSYEKILAYVCAKGYRIALPTREVYLKGPGMIFKGNPNNYLTEIQMLIE